MADFKSLLEQYTTETSRLQEQTKDSFLKLLQEFFDENQGVTTITWNQYTPYFNDGDICEFSIHDVYFSNAPLDDVENVNSWGEYEGELKDVWVESSWRLERSPKEGVSSDQVEDLSNFIHGASDLMLFMIGDHAKVTITRHGIQVDEYDHD